MNKSLEVGKKWEFSDTLWENLLKSSPREGGRETFTHVQK